MAPCVNVSLKCVIPEQPGSSARWRELGFIIASTGASQGPERERQRRTAWGRRGRRRDTTLTAWMIHHMIVLDRAFLARCWKCTLLLSSISQVQVDWIVTLNKTDLVRKFANFHRGMFLEYTLVVFFIILFWIRILLIIFEMMSILRHFYCLVIFEWLYPKCTSSFICYQPVDSNQ